MTRCNVFSETTFRVHVNEALQVGFGMQELFTSGVTPPLKALLQSLDVTIFPHDVTSTGKTPTI
nr:kinesin family protein [Colletotrichum truncatum]KAF6782438.1 kinesin family protein [Colletotrichum truncatum]